jgi:integrase
MAERINFTIRTLSAIPAADQGKRAYYNDAKDRCLQLAVTDRGAKTFYLYRKIKGRPTRVYLGTYPDMTIELARKAFHKNLHKIMDGLDPVIEKKTERAKSVTLQQAFEAYKKARKGLKPKTLYDYERVLTVAFPDWQNRPLLSITKDMVAKRHTALGKQGEAYANLAMRVLRAIFNFAGGQYEDPQGRPLVPENPVKRLSQTRAWYRNKRKDSYIKRHELPAWFKAVLALKNESEDNNAQTVADYLLLLIFTGLRRTEAATLTWNQIDLKAKTLKLLDTKNRENHTLPLPDFLCELLNKRQQAATTKYVFPGDGGKAGYLIEPRKQISKVIEASEISFMLHDLRRTFITVAESLDISAYAVKRLANHKMSGDVTAGYIIMDAERLRKPMQKITDYLLAAAGQRKGQVVKLAERSKTK